MEFENYSVAPLKSSLLQFLQGAGVLDDEAADRFEQLFDELESESEPLSPKQSQSELDFETRSIYALADLFKSLSTNEHYDLAQRLYARWLQEEEDAYERKMRALVNTYANLLRQEKRQFFSTWQTVTRVSGLLAEKERHNAALQNEVERLSMEVDLLTSEDASR